MGKGKKLPKAIGVCKIDGRRDKETCDFNLKDQFKDPEAATVK